MNYSIIYSSPTGNTKMLAEAIKEALFKHECQYFGQPDIKGLNAPFIFVGFWTFKGACDDVASGFLKTIKNKKVFLFGTSGFGGSDSYFERILETAKEHLDPSNEIIGSYMCQGKMPISVRQRYEKMLTGTKEDIKLTDQIDNFDRASSHPDKNDYEKIKEYVLKSISRLNLK